MPLGQKKKTGRYYIGKAEEILTSSSFCKLRGQIQLIFTSPPFPLNSKKSYGNMLGDEYLQWFTNLAPLFSEMLTEDGSIVIELGNSWESQRPVQSLLPLQSLLNFVSHPDANLRLIQEFVCYNPSRLPSPANWVTVERIRTVDSYTRLWWMAKTDKPKADNSKVLRPYSDRIRACYQHACLRYVVFREEMTNESLRKRFAIDKKNYPMASRIITDTINEGLIKPYDPDNKSKKHAKYVPFWT